MCTLIERCRHVSFYSFHLVSRGSLRRYRLAGSNPNRTQNPSSHSLDILETASLMSSDASPRTMRGVKQALLKYGHSLNPRNKTSLMSSRSIESSSRIQTSSFEAFLDPMTTDLLCESPHARIPRSISSIMQDFLKGTIGV